MIPLVYFREDKQKTPPTYSKQKATIFLPPDVIFRLT